MDVIQSSWRRAMTWLAGSRLVRDFVQGNPVTSALAARFVTGPDLDAATKKALDLRARGFSVSLYYLGEGRPVDAPSLIEENVAQKIAIARALGEAGLDVHVSVDPTRIGYALSDDLGERNALRIGRAVAEQPRRGRNLLMLDIEDFGYVQKMLDLRARLVRAGVPTAITIQAYLHRSEQALRQLIADGAAVRLVKGAFAEGKARALTSRPDIDRQYVRLAALLLSPEARRNGVYPIFATHDPRVAVAIRPLLREHGWDRDACEFEMLYGAQRSLQQRLLDEGHRVRLYLPFGTEWWPYTARRIGENPANVRFVWRALRSATAKGPPP